MDPATLAAIRDALARGKKIEAIRVYREAIGSSLAEARDAVEAIGRGEAPPARSGPDFDALCGRAYPNGATGPRAAMDALWKATLQLETWHFAVPKQNPTTPLLVAIEGKTWAFAFTDGGRARRFVTENPEPCGGAHDFVLAIPSGGAREMLSGMRGVFGVHFNYGQPGWFAPIPNLDRIHAHLFG